MLLFGVKHGCPKFNKSCCFTESRVTVNLIFRFYVKAKLNLNLLNKRGLIDLAQMQQYDPFLKEVVERLKLIRKHNREG